MSEVPVPVLSETISWSSDKCHLGASQDNQEQDKADCSQPASEPGQWNFSKVAQISWLGVFSPCSSVLGTPEKNGHLGIAVVDFCINTSNLPEYGIRVSGE